MCCLRDVAQKIEKDLSSSKYNTSISGVKFSWTTLYRGKMISVESAEMQKRLFSQLASILGDSDCENHNRAWTGVSDEVNEGHFVGVNRDDGFRVELSLRSADGYFAELTELRAAKTLQKPKHGKHSMRVGIGNRRSVSSAKKADSARAKHPNINTTQPSTL